MTSNLEPRAEGLHRHLSLAQALVFGARTHGRSRAAFWSSDGLDEVSLADMHARAKRLAASLQARGLGPGTVVAVQLPNVLAGAIAYQAVMLTGATVLPIVHIYGPAEVTFILRQSHAKALLVPDRWRGVDYLERVGGLGHCPDLEHLIVVGERAPEGAVTLAELERIPAEYRLPTVSPDDVALLIYTSGTTADPKGVQHSHNSLLAEIHASQAAYDVQGRVDLSPWPTGHIAGVVSLLRMCLSGAGNVMMDKWDVHAGAQLIERYRVTATVGAPVMMGELLDVAGAGKANLASLTSYGTGAASVPPALIARAEALGLRAYRIYGSSEHPTVSQGITDDPIEKRLGTDGRLCPGVEVRILDDEDRDVPTGGEGEIVTKGPELFIGYRDAVLNQSAFLPGGWFRTGDIGRLDAEGYLTITDRKKDIIIRGGENISSKEVEDILARHPAVAEAAVVAGPHPRLGEMVCAFVLLRAGQGLTLDDVSDHFRKAGVARQKAPERLILVSQFPRTAAGKVKKFELKAQLN